MVRIVFYPHLSILSLNMKAKLQHYNSLCIPSSALPMNIQQKCESVILRFQLLFFLCPTDNRLGNTQRPKMKEQPKLDGNSDRHPSVEETKRDEEMNGEAKWKKQTNKTN